MQQSADFVIAPDARQQVAAFMLAGLAGPAAGALDTTRKAAPASNGSPTTAVIIFFRIGSLFTPFQRGMVARFPKWRVCDSTAFVDADGGMSKRTQICCRFFSALRVVSKLVFMTLVHLDGHMGQFFMLPNARLVILG